MKIICGNAMQLPMTGSWLIDVTAVKPFTIHGDLYYELQAIRVDLPSAGEMTLRVPQHAARQAPAAGERFTVTFLMGQVTAMAIHA